MYTKVNGEQQVQILSPNFSISPSNEDYVLNISANGRDFSPLFAVSAGVTRLVSNVAPGSYYKLVGNQSEVVINWQRMCATEGGSFDPSVLDPYWTSAETQSAITAVEDHLFDVEQVTASALTELHDDVLELSARTGPDMSLYTPTSGFSTINGSAITNGGNILIQGGGGDVTKAYVDSAVTGVQNQLDTIDEVIPAAIVDLNERVDEISASTPSIDLSGYYTSAQTQDAISAATSGKADAANIKANTGNFIFPKWNNQGIISGVSQQVFKSYLLVNDGGTGGYFFMNTSIYDAQNKALKIYTPLSAGTAGEILVSAGANQAPVWSAATQDMVTSTDVRHMVKLSQAAYDQLSVKDPETFYIIVNE